MKALSIRQPRAAQTVDGARTLDVRTWATEHRGPLAVHAGSTRRVRRIRGLGFVPEALHYGAVVGTVTLVDVVPVDEAAWEARRHEHLHDGPFPGGVQYGWQFEDARRLPRPVPVRGRMGLFDVEEDRLGAVYEGDALRQDAHEPTYDAGHLDETRPFALFTLPDGDGYRVALYQHVRQRDESQPMLGEAVSVPGALWGIELGGDALRAVSDRLLAALRANGHRPSDLSRRPKAPFYLDEVTGLRLALVFLAVKPLSRYDRIEAISTGVRHMSDEEAYYWFSKCSGGTQASNAQRALRVLLGS
ncbi:MAG: hypothetical protein AAGI91_12840 [Bacteroidota bacterium]